MNPADFIRLIVCTLLSAAPAGVSAAEDPPNGVFLVATDEIRDPNFRETVVLVTHPRGGGPIGVIINRPSRQRLGEMAPRNEALKGRREIVHDGGPVERNGLVFLVRAAAAPPRSMRVLNDVYLAAGLDGLGDLLQANPSPGLRVYAGYAGWAPGQLQREIERGSWYLLPADAQTVFEKNAAGIWPELIRRAAQKRTRAALAVRPTGSR